MTWLTQALENFTQVFRWWVVIAPWESGLRIRLGKTIKDLSPGIHFRIPFLDRVYVQSTRLRTVTTTGQTVMTKDRKPVTISFAVQLSIQDVRTLYMTIAHPEHTIITLCEGHIARIISSLRSEELTIEGIESEATKLIPSTYGLADVRVIVTALAFARTIRLIQNEWRNLSGMNTEEDPVAGGQRK